MNKSTLIENLKEMDSALAKLIVELEKKRFKEKGTLQCASRKNKTDFYLASDSGRKLLSRSDTARIAELANKQYHDKLLKAARNEKAQIEKCLSALDSGRGLSDIDKVKENMHPAIRDLVVPASPTDEEYVRRWMRLYRASANQTKEVRSALITKNGETVKSKSEIIIADRLFHAGVPYVYEVRYTFNDGMTFIYPDFFILNKRTRKNYIWEHQGKMDDAAYCMQSQLKLEQYAENGWLLGKNLIFTYEGSKRSLSTKYVDELIKEFLL